MLYHGAGALPRGYGADETPVTTSDTAGLITSGLTGLSTVIGSAISGYSATQAAQLAAQQQMAALRMQYQQERALARIQAGSGAGAMLPIGGGAYAPTQPADTGLMPVLLLGGLALAAAVVLLTRK